LQDKIKKISEDNRLSDVNKSLQLGREIAKYCDTEILKRVIKKLPHIKKSVTAEDEFESLKMKLNS
jgi:exonuclease VII small subunit